MLKKSFSFLYTGTNFRLRLIYENIIIKTSTIDMCCRCIYNMWTAVKGIRRNNIQTTDGRAASLACHYFRHRTRIGLSISGFTRRNFLFSSPCTHDESPVTPPPHTHTTIIVVAAARWYNTGARFYDFQRLCSQKAIKPSGVCRTAVSSKSLRRQRRRRRRRCRLLRATAVSGLMEHTFSLYANRIYL